MGTVTGELNEKLEPKPSDGITEAVVVEVALVVAVPNKDDADVVEAVVVEATNVTKNIIIKEMIHLLKIKALTQRN